MPESEAPAHTLAEDVPLRQSRLWALQERYFADQGAAAWSSGAVPLFPTSNAGVAEAYADVIAAWAEDTGAPVQVVELGAGHGRLGYRCLRALLRRGVAVRYTLTDIAQSNVDAWSRHPFLRPYLQQGILRGACHDASAAPPLPDGPLVVIANYCFDGLVTDVFRLERGRLQEGRPVLTAPSPITDDPAIIDDLSLSFRFHPVEPEGYYGDAELDGLLGKYRERMGSGTFCFPLGALRGLQPLLDRKAPTLLLSVDKGRGHLHSIAGQDTVGFASHGSFSFLVNYDAIAQLYAGRGGGVRLYGAHLGSLEGGMFWSGQSRCLRTEAEFDAHLAAFSPSDLTTLYHAFRDQESLSLSAMLSMLRLSRHDPSVYCALYERVLEEAARSAPRVKRELVAALSVVWDNAFPIGGRPDTAFAVGRTLHRIGRHAPALERYQDSLDLTGEHAATCYNMGLCFHLIGQDDRARGMLKRALALDPTFGPARDRLVLLGGVEASG
ncbi:MAG: tetratricopeptide (TPR) repeat protein [Myxococcota bacterium]|jgi:tetratricopeptide (TPR) repeat protein